MCGCSSPTRCSRTNRFQTSLALPLPSSPYRMIQISKLVNCAIDDGIIGLVDPLHGPFVHQSPLWRTPASMHEKNEDI